MCLVRCRLIVTQATPSLALCVANLVVTGNCSEQFRLNLRKHADTTSVSRTTDFESPGVKDLISCQMLPLLNPT